MYLTHLVTIYRKIVGNMKLQLDENTFNAYLNEAIKRELNEAGWTKLGMKGGQKAASKTAGKTSARVITHSPITKKFFGNIKDAKSARKFIMGLKRGKVVSGTVEGGKGAKGLQWFTKDGKKFFTDAACTNQITDPKKLGAVTRSFNGHYTAAANLFNSAQRNMLGTSLVTGLGAGWAIDHAKISTKMTHGITEKMMLITKTAKVRKRIHGMELSLGMTLRQDGPLDQLQKNQHL